MSEFFVGQKVVCIDASHGEQWLPFGPSETLVEKQIYTIKRIFIDSKNDLVVHLNEIERDARSKKEWGPDAGYNAQRFRPLQTKAIEVFRRIARDVTEGKKVRIDA